jgi:hypothetical protein
MIESEKNKMANRSIDNLSEDVMRQYKVFIFIIQVILGVQISMCGFERTSQPTAIFSTACSGTAMFTSDGLWLNPASLGMISSFRASIHYAPSPFDLRQLSNYGMMISQNFVFLNAAVGLQSLGFSLYRESVGSFGTAAMITEEFSAGVTVHLYHLSIEKYGSSLTAVIDAGAICSVTDQMNVGVVVQNITSSSFGADDDIPQLLISGISYRLLEETVINIDLVKDIRYALTYRVGLEFSPMEIISLRTGTEGASSRLFAGVGVHVSSIQVNYGVASHPELGLTHSIGITFRP